MKAIIHESFMKISATCTDYDSRNIGNECLEKVRDVIQTIPAKKK